MALDNTKRVIEKGRTVIYSKEIVFGSWAYESGVGQLTIFDAAWKFTRKCTCSFKYVGLTLSEAEEYRDQLTATFTRSIKSSKWKATNVNDFYDVYFGQACMAEVAIRPIQGEMYEVNVDVNESDEMFRISPNHAFATLFTTENNRDYLGV